MAINQAVQEHREHEAKLIEGKDGLTKKQAMHVAFWRWLVQSRRVTGDLAQDVTPSQKE